MLSGGTGVDGAVKSLNTIADAINGITTAIGALGAAVHGAYKVFDFIGNLGGLIPKLFAPDSYLGKVQAQVKAQDAMGNKGYGVGTGTVADYARTQKEKQTAAAKAKADAKNLAIQKSLNVVNQKNLATQKQSALTAKQALLFNQNAISEVAALKGKLSDEERKKVELMLALEVGNTDQAAILSQQVAQAYDETGQLAAYLRDLPDAANPFAYWDMYLNGIAAKVNSIAAPGTVLGGMNIGGQSSGGGSNTTTIPAPVIPASTSPMDLVTLANQGAGASGGFSPVVAAAMAAAGNSVAGGNQSITLTITGGDAITNAIADSLQNSSLSTGNAAYINRRTGGFE
jgi:hypothetical protein